MLINNEIKNSIDETSIPFNIIANNLFNTSLKKQLKENLQMNLTIIIILLITIEDKNYINTHEQWPPSFKNLKVYYTDILIKVYLKIL